MLQARKEGDPLALALTSAHNSTRRAAQVAVAAAFGSTTLVTGTKTVTVAGMTSLSTVVLTKTAHVGAPGGSQYKVVPSAGQFIVTAIDTSGATVAADLSSFNYKVETPLYHADASAAAMSGDAMNPASVLLSVSAATASDLPTSITLANQLRQVAIQMVGDATAHLVADATNVVSAAIASDLATTQTLLNDVKAKFNAHLLQAGVHVNNDTTNTVATANATDLASSQTLANALKTAINAHLASAPTGDSVALLNA